MLKNQIRKLRKTKIKICYETFFMSIILYFGFVSFFKPIILDHTYKITMGNFFSVCMVIMFTVLFCIIDEKKKD
jgi:hypothetical protein